MGVGVRSMEMVGEWLHAGLLRSPCWSGIARSETAVEAGETGRAVEEKEVQQVPHRPRVGQVVVQHVRVGWWARWWAAPGWGLGEPS